MVTALLVDDEPLANARMQELLAAHPEIEVIGVAGSLKAARDFLETRAPDVVFLDVEMPGGSGLNLLASVPDVTQVVFVTAREKYAVQAFQVAALDYLVKPVDPERLADTVARIRKQTASGQSRPDSASETEVEPDANEAAGAIEDAALRLDDSVSVPLADKAFSGVVTIGDICWIEALRAFTRVALKGPPRLVLFRRRLSDWDKILPADSFARIGRSYLVHLALAEQVEWDSRRETLVMFGEGVEPLTLGRLPAMRLREILGGTA
ncbi:MAG: LytTR family DNA-binding domain-containing protein [Planctomycetes bacterium]|nr:LytTR family DNA-binding domain-containing protein [Planctomycetota bacterium]